MSYLSFVYFFILFIFGHVMAGVPSADKITHKADFLLRADQISHEKDLGVVIARGNVKISDGIEIIEADTVSYNEKLNLVSASGHVKFYDKKGGLTTGNYMEITEDLKNGFVEKVYLITRDKERFAAEIVTKEGDLSTFQKGIYSPCEMCATKPCKPPIWQLRASKIKKDEVEKLISYQNVFLDFKGVPILYLPYLSHPDPSVTRKNGFLMPFMGNSTSLGMILGVPYYFSRQLNEEVLVRPIIMTKENPMLTASYSRLLDNGSISLSASTIYASTITGTPNAEKKNKKSMQGHIIGNVSLDLTQNWRTIAKIERTSSPTYFKKYYFAEDESFRTKNYLNSSLNLEGFYGKNYLSIGGFDFQNLKANVQNDTIPFVAPVVVGSYETSPGKWGEFWLVDLNQAYVNRERGARVERISTTGTFVLPHIFSTGLVQEWRVFLRGDYYDIKKYQMPGTLSRVNQGIGRFIPGTSLTFKYPLIKQFESNKLIIEPMIGAVILPNALNNEKYPNEDSQNFEFEAINLMKSQRFSGFDRIDDGQRLNYGANVNLYSESNAVLQFFGGQSYSFSKENQFDPFSGVQKGFSDYVGRLLWSPTNNYRVGWSFRLGKKSFKPKKNTVEFSGGPSLFRVGLRYTQIHRTLVQNQYIRREQLNTTLSSQFHPNWTVFINQAREFGDQKGELQHGAGLLYHDDCFKIRFDFFRTFYKDRDVVPSKTIMLTIGLKNLGDYSTGSLNLNKGTSALPSNSLSQL